jgi:hypothetical protein
MKANVQYNDFKGTVAADISDFLGGNSLDEVANHFKLDNDRFRLIGLSIYGTGEFHLALRCVDLEKSTTQKEYIVDLSVDLGGKNPLELLFKRFHVSLHGRFDDKFLDPALDSDIESNLGEY